LQALVAPDIIPNIMDWCWTIREEANALTYCAFRRGYIEELHSGECSEHSKNPERFRITDIEMRKLMIDASAKLAELLTLKNTKPDDYWKLIEYLNLNFCGGWKK